MFHVGFDTFVMVVNPINTSWEPTHVIIGIFEIHNTTSVAMANQVKVCLDSFNLLDKIIAYVKDLSIQFMYLLTFVFFLVISSS
jgi:hypothetical protein